jgi:hypothetical protein
LWRSLPTVYRVPVAHLQPQVAVELGQRVGPGLLDRRADVAERVDHGVGLGGVQHRRLRVVREIRPNGVPLHLRPVDRLHQCGWIHPGANRILEAGQRLLGLSETPLARLVIAGGSSARLRVD